MDPAMKNTSDKLLIGTSQIQSDVKTLLEKADALMPLTDLLNRPDEQEKGPARELFLAIAEMTQEISDMNRQIGDMNREIAGLKRVVLAIAQVLSIPLEPSAS